MTNRQLRLLVILPAGDQTPSGIVRGLIYKDLWRKRGYKVKFVSLLSPYLIQLLEVAPSFMRPALSRFQNGRRMLIVYLILFLARFFDVVYLDKNRDYFLLKELRKIKGIRIVFDYNDAMWQRIGRRKWKEMMEMVDAVTCDNKYNIAHAEEFNVNCTVIPDYPQIDLFDLKRDSYKKRERKNIVIGWIGTQGAFSNFRLIIKPLQKLFTKYPNLQLRLVGVSEDPHLTGINYCCKGNYTQQEMIDEVLMMDIGLFPLDNSIASKVRGILKATIYMSGEAAVVASPVGQNKDLFRNGKNGFLAKNDKEWFMYLEKLVIDEKFRKKIARGGLNEVKKNFSLERNFRLLSKVIEAK